MTTHNKLFVAVAGNIGAGKSSLTRLLSEKYGWTPYFESVDDNPYLSDFYGDMRRWSFHLQVYFLSHRFKHHKVLMNAPAPVIQDRSIYEDVEIFARNLHDMGNMDERDYQNYRMLFAEMTAFLKPPDLMIYLRATIDTLQAQIARRGRVYAQSIPRTYLEQLNVLYEDWIQRYTASRLLIIESDTIDFVNNGKDFHDLAAKVEKELKTIL